MALVTVNVFHSNGVHAGSSNVELNSEGRLPVTALEKRFNAQRGFILNQANGALLVTDHQGYSTRTFAAPGPVSVFLPPETEEVSLTMGFVQLLHFAQSKKAHARTWLFSMLYNLCQPYNAITACLHAGHDDKKNS